MEELLKDLDAWWDAFESKEETAQLVFLEETINHTLPENFSEAAGFGDTLLQVIGNIYEKRREFEKIINFLETLQVQQPQLFKEECKYFGYYVFNYHFFQGNQEKLQPILNFWLQNIDEDIDMLLIHFKQLWYRGMSKEAIKLAKAAYHPIKENDGKYINAPEADFSDGIFSDRLQYYYEQSLLPEHSLDLDGFRTEIEAYDYSFKTGFDKKVIDGLDDNYEHPEKTKRFEPKNHTYTFELRLAFQKYMHGLGFHFHQSELIWEEWQKYWWENLKKEGDANHFFKLDYDALDKYLGSMKFIFEPRKYDIFQTLWGGNFVFDFLVNAEIIDSDIYYKALSIIEKMKTACHSSFIYTLWELSFVHRVWPKPEGVDETYFKAEKQLFEQTFRSTENYKETVKNKPELFEHLPVFIAPPVKKQKTPSYKSTGFDFDFFESSSTKSSPPKRKTKAVAKRRKKNKQAKKARKRRK